MFLFSYEVFFLLLPADSVLNERNGLCMFLKEKTSFEKTVGFESCTHRGSVVLDIHSVGRSLAPDTSLYQPLFLKDLFCLRTVQT